MMMFSVGDRVTRTGEFAGITGTVTRLDRASDGSPLVWVQLDEDPDGADFGPSLYPAKILAPLAGALAPIGPGALDRPGESVSQNLITGWLLELPSANTRKAYSGDLRRLVDFLDVAGVELLAAERVHLAAWAESMRRHVDETGARRIAESTIARRLSVASSFYAYAVQVGARADNPLATMKRPRRQIDEDGIVWLDTAQMKAFLAAAAAHSPRSHAIAALMLTTACRTTELLGADVDDLAHTGGHRVLTVTRKGGKRQHLPIAPWVGRIVDDYLAERTIGPLIATAARGGGYGRLDEPALLRLIRRLGEAAGLPDSERLHPHSLRHSAITGALEAGGSLRDVQAMAGHADPRTTERYDRMRGRLDKSPVYALAATLAGD